MDFVLSDKAADYLGRLRTFMDDQIYPAEPVYERQRAEAAARGDEHAVPPVM